MSKLNNTKTLVDMTIITSFVLFIILLITGIVFSSILIIASSFIIGFFGYAILDHEETQERYEELQNKHK